MYADDLVILLASLSGLKVMLMNWLHTCNQLSLSLNANKSCSVYFGPRYNADVDDLMLNNDKITWKSSFKYLGIHFVNRKSISGNIEPVRHNFFMSCSNILSHSSDLCNLVQLQLHKSYVCLHLLMLQRQIKLSETQIASLNASWNAVYRRIFNFNHWESVKLFIPGLCRLDFRHLRLQLSTKLYISMQLFKNSVVEEVFKTFMFLNEFIQFCILYLKQMV